MVRLVQITLPRNKQSNDAVHDVLLEKLRKMEHVYGLADFDSKANFLTIFKSPEKHLGRCLRVLEQLGIGVQPERGAIDMIALAATKVSLRAGRGGGGGGRTRSWQTHATINAQFSQFQPAHLPTRRSACSRTAP